MRLSVLLCTAVGALTLTLTPRAHAQTPLYDEASRKFEKGLWQLDFQSTYYQTDANYSKAGGEYTSLPSGDSYNLLNFDFGARWTPSNRWGIYATSRVANAESKDIVNTRRNSSLTQVLLGTDYLLKAGRSWLLSPDLSVTAPLSRVDVNADDVLNSEGAMEVSAKLIARFRWGRWHPFAYAGFTYRDEDRSSLAPYGAGAELQFWRSALGGEIRGYQTVIKDKFGDNPLQREIVAARDGASLRFDSIDPSLLEANFWYRTQFNENWGFKIGGGTSLTGTNTAAGWNAFAGLSYAFTAGGKSMSEAADLNDSQDNFSEETNDGVDQNLFQPPPPPPPPPEPSPQEQKKKIQKELDQTEFQIELKKPRKKK